jgi:hypothetical protein
VEYAKFGTTGKSFSAGQRTVITALITKVHGQIVLYLGSEPTSTDGLDAIELQGTMNLLWNAEHPTERPQPALTRDLRDSLDRFLADGTSSDAQEDFGTATLRDYTEWYGV